MSEEERQDKILSVMDNVDAAIKFAAYEWNELPDGITNLIDSNAPLNELNKHKKLKRTMNKSTLKSLIRECYREVLAENDSAITKPLDDKIQKDPSFLKQLQAATKEAEKTGNTTNLALIMSGIMKENEEMELPDTRKVYMGDEPSKIDLGVDKRMSSNIDKVKKQIENLTNELKPLIASFNVAQKELQSKLTSKQITKDEYDMQRSLIAKKYDEATRVLVSDLKKAKLADERMIGMLNKL